MSKENNKRCYLGDRKVRKKYPKSFFTSKSVEDRKYGDKNERHVGQFLKRWFSKNSFERDTTGWNEIDYKDHLGKICVELKSRRIRKNTYDTIIIGKNKYDVMKRYMKKGYKGYFLFKFVDKLCIYEVPQKLPHDITFNKGGTYKRGYDETNTCLYIPIKKYLKDCCDFESYEEYIENK